MNTLLSFVYKRSYLFISSTNQIILKKLCMHQNALLLFRNLLHLHPFPDKKMKWELLLLNEAADCVSRVIYSPNSYRSKFINEIFSQVWKITKSAYRDSVRITLCCVNNIGHHNGNKNFILSLDLSFLS